MLKTIKAKSAVGKRILAKREPQVYESTKTALFLKTTTSSEIIQLALKDIYSLKKPHAIFLSKKNELKPFDDPRDVEFFSTKNESAFVVISSHSKKRPHNLVFARMYDGQMLDMVELGLTDIMVLDQFDSFKAALGHTPLITFHGQPFEAHPDFISFKSIFRDFFRGDPQMESIDLTGMDHVISFTCSSDDGDSNRKIHVRVYHILLKKSGTALPRVELEEMGPRFDFVLKRTRNADADVMRQSTKIPKELKPKKEKNIEHDETGHQYGRIHMEKQDFGKLQTRKMKGLKKQRKQDDQAS